MKSLISFLIMSLVFVESSTNVPGSQKFKEFWGPESKRYQNDTSVRPFRIKFEDETIGDLKYRLTHHRGFTAPLEGVGFEYGFNTDTLNGWIEYWSTKYDFKKREAFVNKFPQYKTSIQGLDIHFVWVKPQVPPNVTILPLLLLHGFPGSVLEFYKTIPLLASVSEDREFAVEVIAPALPGFGFSDAAVRPGLGCAEMAVVMRNLMHRLGFHKFYVQGGDLGAIGYQETLGYHTNLAISIKPMSLALWVLGSIYPPLVSSPIVVDRLYPILDYLTWINSEIGYLHIQATKPDTIGVAISDSPSGLLAYILQLISSGSRRNFVQRYDGGLDVLYTRDELLDNLMMYWVPNSFTTACRTYADTFSKKAIEMERLSPAIQVPTWTIHAKDEIFYLTPTMLRFKFTNLLHSTILPGSGHFLALEEPEIFAEDVLKALNAFRLWHRNNKVN